MVQNTFDYVVVGAGSAGCVVANRLTAGGRYKVALVEAGGADRSPWIHIPVGYFKNMGNPATDWCYRTQPDPGLNGRSIPWPRGRVLGGSSSINGLLYVRGQPQDYDHWANLGNEGWSWEEVLPLFRRAESWQGRPSELRGNEGPLTVSETSLHRRPTVDAWLAAAQAAGYPNNPDYNGATQRGVAPFQLTVRRGRRCSSAVAYLYPALGRPNLRVFTRACVQCLLFDGQRVVGVDLGSNRLRACREVVLCAGSIGSPQLLMLSGVGAGEEIQRRGIRPLVDLPGVGQNLQDHLQARPVFKCNVSTVNTETNSLFKKAMIGLEYVFRRTGPMAMAASLGTGFLSTHLSPDRPDIQFHIQPFSADSPAAGPHKFDAFTASVLQLRPESSGHISLVSDRFVDHPEIHPNYLATDLDCQTLVAGIKIARALTAQPPLRDMVTAEHSPGDGVGAEDDAAILQWARDTAVTIYHPIGTCKMGLDELAVVSPRLKVHGLEGLRVADASIMPSIVSGNTNAPAIMIGEKAADMILAEADS